MRQNIEIKARISDLSLIRKRVESLATSGPTVLLQEDVFFASKTGRLKLRTFGEENGELIYYQREDSTGPKTSHYSIVSVSSAIGLREILSATAGVIGVVRKLRTVFLIENTRIHLDQVEGLGEFMELEVVLAEDQTPLEGIGIARRLLQTFAISEDQLVSGAYFDLMRLSTSGSNLAPPQSPLIGPTILASDGWAAYTS